MAPIYQIPENSFYYPGYPPPDPELEARKALAKQTIALGEISDTYLRSQLQNQYGIGDTSNPYSRAKLLEKSYRDSQAGNINSYARMGQLYSGALQKAQMETTSKYNQNYDAMQRDYSNAQNKITQGRLARYANAGQPIDDATYQSLRRSLQGLT